MEMEAYKFIGMGLVALGMLGAAIGVGLIFGNAAQGVARNPSAVGQIRGVAILGAVFAEFMGLLSFVLGIMIMLKL
ncbi:MAG: F0F1 ATP synthase subunit C [Azospirillum brasilense]|jgi:F-type H+-transporting ATPase subunit c|nr:MAG: F0F1 ATP synthase subunit C [Azospirillum brasilense]